MTGEAECLVDEQQWPDINPLEWFQPTGEEAEQVGSRCKSQAKCLSTDRGFRSRTLRKGLVMSTGGWLADRRGSETRGAERESEDWR